MNNTNKPSNVSRVTRDAVISAAEHVQIIKEKTDELIKKTKKIVNKAKKGAEKKWEESKSYQENVKDELKKTSQKVVDFGKDVKSGFKDGLNDLKKRK